MVCMVYYQDPVTGSAHCTLGPYWAAKLGKTDLNAYQVRASLPSTLLVYWLFFGWAHDLYWTIAIVTPLEHQLLYPPPEITPYKNVLVCGLWSLITVQSMGRCIVWLTLGSPIVWPTVYTIPQENNPDYNYKPLWCTHLLPLGWKSLHCFQSSRMF